ncbi:MAG: DNA-binding transcriptional regulator [Sedimentisphaerales bacterium]|nr:DNA-binding transcriptional regulator [Sedimentisphaerales bacterium]
MEATPKVIVLIEHSRACGRRLLRGIAKYANLHGPWIFYREPPSYLKEGLSKKALRRLKHWHADGIITRDSVDIEEIRGLDIPTIFACESYSSVAGYANIIDNCDAAGELAAQHLLDHGFRSFAYCGYSHMLPWSDLRGQAFARAVAQAGYETMFYEPPGSRKKGMEWDKEAESLSRWLKSLSKPVGLMACADHRSQQVLDACRIAQLRVPEEVAIVGVDNDDLICNLSDIPLSSVATNDFKAGYEAAELLDLMMKNQSPKTNTIVVQPSHVAARQSTDTLAVHDLDVAAALHFIRRNSKRSIEVGDVVKKGTLSRRVLEKRFRQVLGRSVLSEIRRARVDQVAKQLVETNLSVSSIALSLDYRGVDHLSRYFRREKGMSPLAYRKEFGQK